MWLIELRQDYNSVRGPEVSMSTVLAERPMAKRNDVPVKIDAEVLAMARIASAYKGVSLAEYLSESLRPIAMRDIDESHARLAKPPAKPKGGK
jgi:hypothetical protein